MNALAVFISLSRVKRQRITNMRIKAVCESRTGKAIRYYDPSDVVFPIRVTCHKDSARAEKRYQREMKGETVKFNVHGARVYLMKVD